MPAFHPPRAARLVVVDNASTDGSATLAVRLAPWAEVIRALENLGFAGATTCHLLLLNTDANRTAGMVEARRMVGMTGQHAGGAARAQRDGDPVR